MAGKTQKYKALVIITHSGHNKYYGPPLKEGQKETLPGVIRGTEFDLDHQDDVGIAKLIAMGAVVAVEGAPVKRVSIKKEN